MKTAITISLLILFTACSSPTANNDHSGHMSTANNAASRTQDHNSMVHGGMDHGMMNSSPGAASATIQLQFLDTMIAHHKGAIEMANLAEGRAEHAEIKELATNIIQDQEREIGKMTEWRDRWFSEKPEAINIDFPGMSHGMGGMDVKKLASLKGNEFDLEFIRQMIPHHEGAVEMAKSIRSHDTYAELKELADDIITAQEAEIKQMREWSTKWR